MNKFFLVFSIIVFSSNLIGMHQQQRVYDEQATQKLKNLMGYCSDSDFISRIPEIKNLIQAYANPNIHFRNCLSFYRTILKTAALLGESSFVTFLLQYGADVNDAAPLQAAIFQNHDDIAEQLLNAGADVHFALSGATPLGLAIGIRSLPEIALILQYGGASDMDRPNPNSNNNRTPLTQLDDYDASDREEALKLLRPYMKQKLM